MAPGKPGKFQGGGAMVAIRNGAPVAHNAGLFWPKNGFIKRPGVVQVRIGKPIPSVEKKPRN